MYLHRLELRAIGPYPDLVTIDFAALAASGVFLLEGPTGSGKSTIIDAVVFALYGGIAGSDASTDRLHSQHADPAVEPFVDLVFETGAGVFRVRRTPQYDRPKQRGTGTVKQQASVQLHRLSDPTDVVGEPLSSRIPEAAVEITRIVGLDKAQFLQTVVLPQGEFARFLRSPGEERRKLLQSLFGTQVYDRTADELAARRRLVQAEVDAADARVRDALNRFSQAAGVDEPDESTVPDTLTSIRAAAAAAEASRVAAARTAADAVAHEHAVTARAAALDRRAALLGRRAELDADAGRVASARERLAVGERAARVAAVADGLDAARSRAVVAAADAARLRSEHGVAETGDDLAHRRTTVAETRSAVGHLVAVAEALPGRRRSVADAAVRGDRLRAELEALDASLASRPDERQRIVEAVRVATETASDAEAARAEVDRVGRLRADLHARDSSQGRVDRAERTVAGARVRAHEAVRAEQDLRERRIAGLAGELGAALAPGDACPVCGATEHPVVAAPQDDHPTTEAIDAAAEQARRAEQGLSDAATLLAVERAELDRLTAALGDTDQRVVDALEPAATERVTVAQQAAAAVRDLERQRAAHDDDTRALERQRHDLDAQRSVLAATTAAEASRIEQDSAAIRAAVDRVRSHLDADQRADTDGADGDGADIDGAESARTDAAGSDADRTVAAFPDTVAALDALARRLDAVARADDAAEAAARAVQERTAEVDRALAEQDLPDVTAARAALLGAGDAERLRDDVARADRERAVVEAGLAEPAVVAAADDPAAADPGLLDPDGARAAREHAAQVAEDTARTAVTATDRARATEACVDDLAEAVRARDDTSARSRAVVRLADVAAGVAAVNPTGITLGTYVLMRRFEDVVAAANDRLRGMLAGRFALETSDERESGSRARRTGLALAVHDHTTDTVRDPRSLSGGETFTVSLCLALGLADVVQAEAGGVSLGTLFVDEGFGTLDPETLDDVIGQLARLTAGGRQVGIVSHVEELKQRIPERIAVRRTARGGSHVTTTV